MRKTCFSVILLIFISSLSAQSWLKVTDFPAAGRDDGSCFIINNIAYCGGGVKPFITLGDFYAFHLISENWSAIASLPQGNERQYASGFSFNGLGYLFGGYRSAFLKDFWQYNPQTNKWSQKTNFPSSARGGTSIFVIDSIAYIIGGKTTNARAIREIWAYDLINESWHAKKDLPFGPRWRSGACALGGKGYLAFGLDDSLNYSDEIWEYNPLTDSWSFLTQFPEGGRNYTKLHGIGTQLITIGGNDSAGNFLNECWSYDMLRKKWNKLANIPGEGRRGGMSFQSQSAIYYTTGLADSSERLVETLKLVSPTTLEEVKNEQDFTIFPNPIKNYFFIDIQNSKLKNMLVKISGANGNLIWEKEINQPLQLKVDCKQWKKGVYFLHILQPGQRISKKLIKL